MDEEEHVEEEVKELTGYQKYKILEEFSLNVIENTTIGDLDFSKTVDRHFWELI